MAIPSEAVPAGEDRRLVLAARAGATEARESLARRHRHAAYLFALHLLRDPDDALDVAHDALLKFFETLPHFDPERPVRPWLLTLVRNRARDLWRRRRVRRAESLDGPAGDLSRQIADPRSDPERDAGRAELRRRLWRALSRLPRAQREILVLRDYHDLTYAEVATVLGVPLGTVMSRLHRARRALGRVLGGREGDPR